MDYLFYSSSLFTLLFALLIGIVVYKVMIKKERPSNYYTPFDHIAGQSIDEFHEERQEDEQEEEEDEGDDKDR
ncbi:MULTISPECIES: DUF3951 domain-containing protein [Pontibacillus]|uniref:DUF3951 domain-containing protein n=1 Tax=Pontibacillus chungwhensis TaxID=265426 RepID=A0ABY8UYS3_9BACI|nr:MULTISPECIES: DUF3951 domain-containing protein [Pontibacillus]MCD5323426.1 DUF3951 domain-containing protein [Pontibacillus sp. HN14]WIF96806.1 DUF3951 domain-containing protein [Pontibacillus chungwhensis]